MKDLEKTHLFWLKVYNQRLVRLLRVLSMSGDKLYVDARYQPRRYTTNEAFLQDLKHACAHTEGLINRCLTNMTDQENKIGVLEGTIQ